MIKNGIAVICSIKPIIFCLLFENAFVGEKFIRLGEVNTAYHRYPIRDHDVPSAETMISILNAIDKAIENGGCAYIHCWGGVGRTGMVVGCYLVRHGIENKQALARVNQLYKTRPNNPYFSHSPENNEQIEFILNWHEG